MHSVQVVQHKPTPRVLDMPPQLLTIRVHVYVHNPMRQLMVLHVAGIQVIQDGVHVQTTLA